jgi:hypothetical protein
MRYFLEQTAGTAQLGIFSALASLVIVGQTAVSALGNVVSPRLAKFYAAGQNVRYRNLLLGTIGGMGGPVVVAQLTDRVFGVDGVRYSLALTATVGMSIAVALLAAGLGSFRASLAGEETKKSNAVRTT